jgi:leucyl aminopeptidase
MKTQVSKGKSSADVIVTLFKLGKKASPEGMSKDDWSFVRAEAERGIKTILIQPGAISHFFIPLEAHSMDESHLEKLRMTGAEIQAHANKLERASVLVVNDTDYARVSLSIVEGITLSNYQFLKYRKDRKERLNTLSKIYVSDPLVDASQLVELNNLAEGVGFARDMINEPHSFLTATQFAREMDKAGKVAGFTTEILNKKKIEALRMGGLLGVNKGSIDPPTFTIMEYKPRNAKNKKPIVLVGKGVVFDTGGLSLKPTPGSMDEMKCDMSGGAAVAGVLFAIAANKLPVHVIGLVPATDNRPGMNAIVPQDVITISDGTTVEVLNTDAEGRLILADALVYAKRFHPELVVDLATLTGAAVRAIGSYASAVMGTAPQHDIDELSRAGMGVWERTIQFPLWSDYGEEMKSQIADLKNLGGGNAGHISAGKFLEHFTSYPWIHIDIAGPAYIKSTEGYRTHGGTGVGVRLLYRFIKNRYSV